MFKIMATSIGWPANFLLTSSLNYVKTFVELLGTLFFATSGGPSEGALRHSVFQKRIFDDLRESSQDDEAHNKMLWEA